MKHSGTTQVLPDEAARNVCYLLIEQHTPHSPVRISQQLFGNMSLPYGHGCETDILCAFNLFKHFLFPDLLQNNILQAMHQFNINILRHVIVPFVFCMKNLLVMDDLH